MRDIAKNVGEFQHGGYWILELGILNVHHLSINLNPVNLHDIAFPSCASHQYLFTHTKQN